MTDEESTEEYGTDFEEYAFQGNFHLSREIIQFIHYVRKGYEETRTGLHSRAAMWAENIEEIQTYSEYIGMFQKWMPDQPVPTGLYRMMNVKLLSTILDMIELFEFTCIEAETFADDDLGSSIEGFTASIKNQLDQFRKEKKQKESGIQEVRMIFEGLSTPPPHMEN